MTPSRVLYVARAGALADRVARRLRESGLDVRTTTGGDIGQVDAGTLACIVYEGDGTDALAVRNEMCGDRPAVPLLLVVPPGRDASLVGVLAAERTDVVRAHGDAADASVLASRVETLVDGYRRDRTLARERERFETLFEGLTQPTVEVEFEGGARFDITDVEFADRAGDR